MLKSVEKKYAPRFTIKVLLSLFLFALSTNLNAQNKNFRLLKKAYRKDSKELLHQFFQNWDQEIPPISAGEFAALNDTLQHAYAIFESFYTPRDLSRLVGFPYSESYSKTNFLLVQNAIHLYRRDQIYYSDQEIDSILLSNIYRIYDVEENDIEMKNRWKKRFETDREEMLDEYGPIEQFNDKSTDTLLCKIDDFRPRISPDSAVVYLSSDYKNGLSNFLGDPNEFYYVANKKQVFLEYDIDISQDLLNNWDFNTYPTAYLVFDKNFEYCLVRFWIHMSSGEAILKRNGERWELISSKQTGYF